MEEVIVSVCMLAYNHEKYIREAIDGVLMQKTSFPVQLVIGEDYSKDGTRIICEEYASKNPGIIRLLPSDKNHGMVPNFIRTLKACDGRYVALCEGDDYWIDPYKLQSQVDFMEKKPEYVICYGDSQPFNEKGLLDHDFGGARKDLSSEELMKGTPIFTHTTLFRNVVKQMPPEFTELISNERMQVWMSCWSMRRTASMPSRS
jgi:glycosyltransferase involved in cell wall biosynthesis